VPGTIVDLRIVEATPHSLIGESAGDPGRLAAVKAGRGTADVAMRSAAAGG
jgi:hypothetical protein